VTESALTYEWIVVQDGDPRDVTLYRGPSEVSARDVLAETTPVAGWGASLYRRWVSPLEKIDERR